MSPTAEQIPTVPLERTCQCGRPLGLRLTFEGLRALRARLDLEDMEPEEPILTSKCRDCKSVTTLTAADLFLTEHGLAT